VFAPFFAFMTGAIAIPTGVKFFNWIATMWRGQIRLTTSMLFGIGFLMLFLIGGIDGVFLGSPPIDYHFQDTYWVVSHLHYVLFTGAVFGIFTGFYYWWPKMTGRFLHEGLGKIHFGIWFIAANLTFIPMHILGLQGMRRRIANYDPTYAHFNQLATPGASLHGIGMIAFPIHLVWSFRQQKTATADPWQGNSIDLA